MKHFLLALALAGSLTSCTAFLRPIPIQNGKLAGILPLRDSSVYYDVVEQVPGISAETIYRQARRWVAFRTIDPKAPFQFPDPLSRDIIGPGRLSSHRITPQKRGQFLYRTPITDYTVSVECYDGKYRLTFTHFRELLVQYKSLAYTGDPIELPTSRPLSNTKQYFRDIDTHMLALAESFRAFVTRESALK